MFKFTTTSFINGSTYLNGEPAFFALKNGTFTYPQGASLDAATSTNTSETSFTVNRNVKFIKEAVTKITKCKYTLPENAEMTIDFSVATGVTGTDNFRLYLYIRSIGDADPMYANDFIYKGRPLYIEFQAGSSAADTATKFAKTANKWIKLLYANGNIVKVTASGSKVTLKATDEYKKFYVAEIQKYDENALKWAHDGAFVTLYSSDENSAAYTQGVFNVVKAGQQGYGTYTQLIKDLRLPTDANLAFWRNQENEMPIATGKYWQYVITQCTERPEMQGTSVLGQYNKSITTHVVFVEDSVQAEFNTMLASLGVTIEDAAGSNNGSEEANP